MLHVFDLIEGNINNNNDINIQLDQCDQSIFENIDQFQFNFEEYIE